jgi:acetoin:2,6-dichlorophenolindophenol oxidoreductase subunit alpha
MEGWLSETKVYFENPLVPNTKLRQMYLAMAEARALDEHVTKLQKRGKSRQKFESTSGQEACRVSTATDLGVGDLISDSQVGVVMELLAGAKVDSLLERVASVRSGKKIKAVKVSGVSARLLPWIDDVEERLRMAIGAAASFKALGRKDVVVAYVRHGEVAKGVWRSVLGLASKLELPVIFVVLPAPNGSKKAGVVELSGKTVRWGVPGIPVDAADAVALYRVAQESLGRTRAGDGPVLIECLEYRTEGKGKRAPVDPLVSMKEFLLTRQVGTEAWLKAAGDRVRRDLAAAGNK